MLKHATALVLLAGALLSAAVVGAELCADADKNGKVTVSDAVNHLRAAAALESTCTAAVCDLNLDGHTTVTDGARALRVAAELEPVPSCVLDQAQSVLARTQGILEVGVGVVNNSSALRSAAGVPCPDGGSFVETSTVLTYVDCRDGDVVSNGSVSLTDVVGSQDREASFQGFTSQRLSTDETLVSSGTLVFSPRANGLAVNGTISRSSNLLGEFTEAFLEVVADTSADTVSLRSGTVVTTVTHGIGAFASVATLQANIVGPQLTIVLATFAGGAQEVAIFADNIGLCDPCTESSQCNSQLACLPCSSDCTGATLRCTVDFQNFAARCGDGLF